MLQDDIHVSRLPFLPICVRGIFSYLLGKKRITSISMYHQLSKSGLSLRQRVVAIRRRSASPCQSGDGLSHQLALFHAYHNFVLPHASLRQALEEPIPTNGSGSAKQWRPCTPAMAAGLTDHAWSLREVLMFRVPPWPQPQTV
jgi:hypothetical protein